jgi:hypothetical protein
VQHDAQAVEAEAKRRRRRAYQSVTCGQFDLWVLRPSNTSSVTRDRAGNAASACGSARRAYLPFGNCTLIYDGEAALLGHVLR